jgi:hypothetical protein
MRDLLILQFDIADEALVIFQSFSLFWQPNHGSNDRTINRFDDDGG